MLTCMLCAAVLPALMDPNNELTVTDYNGGIMNANLYFSSWGAFIWSFLVLTGFMKEKFGVTKTFSPTSWGALCMTSIIAMVSGARLFHNLDCNNVDENMDDLEKMCNRTSLAVGLGAVVGLISAVWMLLGLFTTGFLNDIMELGLSTLSMALWTFGVGYVTFGDNAPATAVGNLYFFTWGSFAISVMILVTSLNMFKSKRTAGESGGDVEAGHGQTDDKKEKADENVRETEDEA